jgi:hypothetical protein
MSALDELRARIEQGVREQLLPVVFEASVALHKRSKHIWKTCDCQWCSLKRQHTVAIGHAGLTGMLKNDPRSWYNENFTQAEMMQTARASQMSMIKHRLAEPEFDYSLEREYYRREAREKYRAERKKYED